MMTWATIAMASMLWLLSSCQITPPWNDGDKNDWSGQSDLFNEFTQNCDTLITVQTSVEDYPKMEYAIRRTDDYMVNGKKYDVIPPDSLYEGAGEASWYGPGFHGDETAATNVFNQNKISAASPVLPLPSVVEVYVNNLNGECRRMIIPVIDRGPYHEDRIIDLSHRAAEKLEIMDKGVSAAYVRLDPVKTSIIYENARVDTTLPNNGRTP